jgi:uridine kinase
VIRLPLLFYGGSHYFTDLFIPFLDHWATHPLQNPWSAFPPHYFPYGSALLIFCGLPKLILYNIFGTVAVGSTALSYASLKGVLFVFDFLLFIALSDLVDQEKDQILIFYWLNPILIFITYFYGQLDVIPICFSILAILQMTRDNSNRSAIFTAVSGLCKANTLLIVPFLCAYIWNTNFQRSGIEKIARFCLIFAGLMLIGSLPLIAANHLSYAFFSSPEAMSIFGTKLQIDSKKTIYLGFFAMCSVLARLCLSTRISARGLFYGSGVLYGVLILSTSTMPGWYFWFFPFVAIFYANHSTTFISIYFGAVLAYMCNFVVAPYFHFSETDLFSAITFNILQLMILGLLVLIWTQILKLEVPIIRRMRPLLIGISGNSSSGKNTMTNILQNLLGSHSTAVLEGDDYHKWERGHDRWQDYTHLNPRANFLEMMAENTKSLLTGRAIYQKHYDHSAGKFTKPRLVKTSKNIIINGLHTFYLKSLRDHFDLKVFLSPNEDLRVAWKINRDVRDRGASVDQVLASIDHRKQDAKLHIEPQREMADWIIEYKPVVDLPVDPRESLHIQIPFSIRHLIWNDTPLTGLIDSLKEIANVDTMVATNPAKMDQVCVEFLGEITACQVQAVAKACFSSVRHLTRSTQEPMWLPNSEGLLQLMALSMIARREFVSGLQ